MRVRGLQLLRFADDLRNAPGPPALQPWKKMKKLPLFVALAAGLEGSILACDLCSIYSATEARGEIGRGFFAGAAEQFTHFGTLQQDGEEVGNPSDQFLDSSVSQLFAGYNFTERFGVQFNAPIIYRSFRRVEEGAIDKDSEWGLGDVTLTAHFQVVRYETRHSTFAWNILGGIKFPTGSTDRLEEETHEEAGAEESGVHGHDLTLGSGSYDGIVGTTLYGRLNRFFMSASLQYAIRTEGDFDYTFANDLTWSGGPGFLLVLNDYYTVSLQANVSGETKGRDEFRGEKAEDTGITSVYIGPEFVVTWGEKLSAELGFDWPVSLDNTALQIVPDYRVRAALTWHF
jgi:hypothetical protein